MIHYLYVGHFEHQDGAMKMEKQGDGRPRPVVARPLNTTVIHQLLREKGLQESTLFDQWGVRMEDEAFLVVNAHTSLREAKDFIYEFARRTGCDIFYDGLYPIAPEELAITSEIDGCA